MFQPAYPIRTPRLTLRPVTEDDLDDVYAWQRRPDVVRWMDGAGPRTREQSRVSVLAMAAEDALRAQGDCLTSAVTDDSGVIGIIELVWRSEVNRTAELQSHLFRGEWADQFVFAVLAEQWRARTAHSPRSGLSSG